MLGAQSDRLLMQGASAPILLLFLFPYVSGCCLVHLSLPMLVESLKHIG